jgi:4-hydroxy-3-methylbut-2-enyl diphosphate reductase
MEREIVVASPRGFCAGVSHAIEIVDLVLDREGAPIYVRHEIVHNRHVVERLRRARRDLRRRARRVPDGSVLIFSAHGVSPAVRAAAAAAHLRVIDATCPLVTKVHVEALRYARDGYDILVIGHRGHVEVGRHARACAGADAPRRDGRDVDASTVRDPQRVAVVTQTTLSVDDTRDIVEAIRQRFPAVHLPAKDDICYATQNRQTAIKEVARQSETVLVIGSPTSSNANRLVEVSRNAGTPAHLIEDPDGIDPAWVADATTVGLTAGASTPEELVQAAIVRLRDLGFTRVRDITTAVEHVVFPLPRGLRDGALPMATREPA